MFRSIAARRCRVGTNCSVQHASPSVKASTSSLARSLPSRIASSSQATSPVFISATHRPGSQQPLPTFHAAFDQQQLVVPPSAPSSTPTPASASTFTGPVSISGVFVSVAPCFFLRSRFRRSHHAADVMRPNAQITIRDNHGLASRVRYRCQLQVGSGMKIEAMLRFQVGWISPKVTYAQVPEKIYLGRGIDVSVPFLFHFTCVDVLDERGCTTGSCLYFSGTPMFGLSLGIHRIDKGELTLTSSVDPQRQSRHFIGKVHYRQLFLVAFKVFAYLFCGSLCVESARSTYKAKLLEFTHNVRTRIVL